MLIISMMTETENRSRNDCIEALIERMSIGDSSALGELYELTSTDVYAYALSKTANKEDAEDVSHDTFVQVWKNAALYRPMGKPLAWIFTIEINIIRKRYNKSKRIMPLDEAIEVESGEDDFAQRVIDSEFLRCLLASLTEEEREVITLHVVSGMKHKEIARLLGKPLSTVLSKYNRAIKKLQLQIKEKEGK